MFSVFLLNWCSLISDQNWAAAAAASGAKRVVSAAERGELMALIGDDWKLFWPRGFREINRKAHSAASGTAAAALLAASDKCLVCLQTKLHFPRSGAVF